MHSLTESFILLNSSGNGICEALHVCISWVYTVKLYTQHRWQHVGNIFLVTPNYSVACVTKILQIYAKAVSFMIKCAA